MKVGNTDPGLSYASGVWGVWTKDDLFIRTRQVDPEFKEWCPAALASHEFRDCSSDLSSVFRHLGASERFVILSPSPGAPSGFVACSGQSFWPSADRIG